MQFSRAERPSLPGRLRCARATASAIDSLAVVHAHPVDRTLTKTLDSESPIRHVRVCRAFRETRPDRAHVLAERRNTRNLGCIARHRDEVLDRHPKGRGLGQQDTGTHQRVHHRPSPATPSTSASSTPVALRTTVGCSTQRKATRTEPDETVARRSHAGRNRRPRPSTVSLAPGPSWRNTSARSRHNARTTPAASPAASPPSPSAAPSARVGGPLLPRPAT